MATGQDIVAAARGYLGTKFRHQGRVRGVGIDCVGLVIGVAHELGLSEFDTTAYARRPDASDMEAILGQHLDRVPLEARADGDVLHMALDGIQARHVAIVSGGGAAIIHVYAHPAVRRCVEHPLDASWLGRVKSCWRFPGLG